MREHRRSQGVWVLAVVLLAVSCSGGSDRPVSGVGMTLDTGTQEAEHHHNDEHDHHDADGGHGGDVHDDGEGVHGEHGEASGAASAPSAATPRTTEQTLAAIRALDPERLASLHDHHGDHDHHAERVHPNGIDPDRIVISAIDVDADVIDLGLQADGSMEVPSDFDQAGWFSPGPRPGRVGPAVIAGHVDSRDGPAVFFRLAELEIGDEIEVHGEGGDVVTFAVREVEQHPKDAFPTERVYAGTPGAELRLVTCGGVFDATERSYRDNIIVFAHRVDR